MIHIIKSTVPSLLRANAVSYHELLLARARQTALYLVAFDLDRLLDAVEFSEVICSVADRPLQTRVHPLHGATVRRSAFPPENSIKKHFVSLNCPDIVMWQSFSDPKLCLVLDACADLFAGRT